MKTLFLTAVLAFSLSVAAQEVPEETIEIRCFADLSHKSVSVLFEEYLIGEGLFSNSFFKPTIFLEGNFNALPLDEKSPFQHTQRGAIYTNDFLTYMPR